TITIAHRGHQAAVGVEHLCDTQVLQPPAGHGCICFIEGKYAALVVTFGDRGKGWGNRIRIGKKTLAQLGIHLADLKRTTGINTEQSRAGRRLKRLREEKTVAGTGDGKSCYICRSPFADIGLLGSTSATSAT